MFLDNIYTKWYYQIIDNARHRLLPADVYTEKHHIIPQSFFKSRNKTGWIDGDHNAKENLVKLTAREHFVCHRLLTKMTIGEAHFKMANAAQRLLYSKKSAEYVNSRNYESIRKTISDAKKGRPVSKETREKIRQGNLNRVPASDETRKKLSDAAKRRKGFTEEGRAKVVAANTGKIVSEETKEKLRIARANQVIQQGTTMTDIAREKLSKAAEGRIFTDEHKQKLSNAHKGKIFSQETREKMRQSSTGRVKSTATLQKLKDAAAGKPKTQIQCPYCLQTGGLPQMKRWHYDNCKLKI